MKKLAITTGWIAVVAILGVLVGYLIPRHMQPAPDSKQTAERVVMEAENEAESPMPRLRAAATTPPPREVSLWETNAFSKARSQAQPTNAVASAAPPPVRRDGSAAVATNSLRQLSQINLSEPLTRDQAAEANRLLRQLAEQGPAAVPAIRQFLAQKQDVNFDAVAGGEFVIFGSLRLGIIDALRQIGGPEAIEASAEMLQNTSSPAEVSLLAWSLEDVAPGQYRHQALTAASDALAHADRIGWSGDVSPLFETLQAYGDASVVPVLKQAATKWNYYATMALAGLSDGAGIPALIELAQDTAISSLGPGDFALRPLAQVVVQYPAAAQALVDLARVPHKIPDSAWPTIIASLTGTQIQYGSQIFGSTTPPVHWSNTEVNQRIALIDQLLSVTPDYSSARPALQRARASLLGRLRP